MKLRPFLTVSIALLVSAGCATQQRPTVTNVATTVVDQLCDGLWVYPRQRPPDAANVIRTGPSHYFGQVRHLTLQFTKEQHSALPSNVIVCFKKQTENQRSSIGSVIAARIAIDECGGSRIVFDVPTEAIDYSRFDQLDPNATPKTEVTGYFSSISIATRRPEGEVCRPEFLDLTLKNEVAADGSRELFSYRLAYDPAKGWYANHSPTQDRYDLTR
jgi:hypothetical protein